MANSSETVTERKIDAWDLVIDPGHGGHATGVIANNLRECDINLAVAQQVVKLDKLLYPHNLYSTRNIDIAKSYRARAAKLPTDKTIVICLHCDSAPPDRLGANVYCDQGDDLAWFVSRRILDRVPSRWRRSDAPIHPRPETYPGVTTLLSAYGSRHKLVYEMGYLTNRYDAERLSRPEARLDTAINLVKALQDLLNKLRPGKGLLDARQSQAADSYVWPARCVRPQGVWRH